jgi:DNA helicase-2/ATP-dependent DNA helicase PcrA
VLDESGYTEMWQKDRSADAAGRLDNLKELVRSMEEFENLQGFLEHISLVMDREGAADEDAVSLMTLHSAKGLEFDNVFLPGWEEGLFPSQRTLDDQGRAGLEEERRLAHVGLTRARKRAKLYFATNRRIHGTWSTTIPSRFLDELPSAQCRDHRERRAAPAGAAAAATARRASTTMQSSVRATARRAGSARRRTRRAARSAAASASTKPPRVMIPAPKKAAFSRGGGASGFSRSRMPLTIEGELVAKSTGTTLGIRARRPRVPPEIRLRPRQQRSTATNLRLPLKRQARRRWSTAL